MDAMFVIELIFSVIFVAVIGVKTLQDLEARNPCHSIVWPYDDEEDD